MGKRARKNGRTADQASGEPSVPNAAWHRWAPAIVVGAIVGVLGYSNIRQTREMRQLLDLRLGEVDSKLAALSKSVEQVGKQAAASPRRGPDPNRVYTIKTEGSPAKGPATAPVTIAEFSDFQ